MKKRPEAYFTVAAIATLTIFFGAIALAAPLVMQEPMRSGMLAYGFEFCDVPSPEDIEAVLGGPPKPALSEAGATMPNSPGCPFASVDGKSRVQLNVWSPNDIARIGVASLDAQFAVREKAHRALGGRRSIRNLESGALRFGFSTFAPKSGVLLIQTPTRVIELIAEGASAARVETFARATTAAIAQRDKPGAFDGTLR